MDECEVPRGLRFYQWVDYFDDKKDDSYIALVASLKLRYEQKLKVEEEERLRKEQQEREAAERVAQEKAEKEAAEQARLKAEEEEQRKIAKQKAELEAAERVAREKTEKEAAEKERLKIEEEQKRITREKVERDAAEKATREKEEKETAEKLRLKAEEDERQRIAKEKADREIAEKVAREKAEKEVVDKARRDAAEKAKQERLQSRNVQVASLKEALSKPYLRMVGFISVVAILAVIGIQSLPKADSTIGNATPDETASQEAAPTFTFIPSSFTAIITSEPTATRTQTPEPLPTQITDLKGIVLNLVPAGEFTMGSDKDDESPIHQVYLDAFYMDIYEVTNAKYQECVVVGVCTPPQQTSSYTHSNYYGKSLYDNFPVINVDWNQANNYCAWRGASLPTEAQWEKAARGTDGRTYPWGEGISCTIANFWDGNYCVGDTTEVGSYEDGKSPYGIYDMAGNVYEWVADWYDLNYYVDSPSSNPLGPTSGQYRMLRGGAFNGSDIYLRASDRSRLHPINAGSNYGFRCVMSVP
ncbi:MAG: SUMF1/EgtB/PvdO family nonheme iron enzyme [Anaerolineales bacterium]|nr:SUMF1/EgtB/PvdO family nonheme iron enzyme [Anaerolineales bacterium]